jgi:predicted nucleic acid-binding protein
MIAAQALVADATWVTRNPDDFADVPNLKVLKL